MMSQFHKFAILTDIITAKRTEQNVSKIIWASVFKYIVKFEDLSPPPISEKKKHKKKHNDEYHCSANSQNEENI